MERLNDLREKYHVLFDRVLSGYEFVKKEDNSYHFINEEGLKLKLTIGGDTILVDKEMNGKEGIEFIELPGEGTKFVSSMEMIIEKLDEGIKVDEIRRFYGKTSYDDNYYVTDLYHDSKCGNKEFDGFHNSFESHMRVMDHNGHKVNTSITKYNYRDISKLYRGVSGPFRVEKIFDLYNGNNTKLIEKELTLIELGLLDQKCFDYKTYNGVRAKEEEFLSSKVKKI